MKNPETAPGRRIPIGAELIDGSAHLRVWAPKRKTVEVALEGSLLHHHKPTKFIALAPENNGYFSGFVEGLPAHGLYRFRLDGDSYLYPDPASRYQPEGPHGPSCLVDPSAYRWNDADWNGMRLPGQVIYELHVGAFTHEGTWNAAERELRELHNLGITIIEVMPLADFPGRFGWGYDGVNMFAPTRLYGSPDDFRHFVDTAHGLGLGVLLDVVYNHFGPDGNYLGQFSDHYQTKKYTTEWGDPINYDSEDAGPVREFFIANAGYWIDEFHLDGLRLDATQNIYDSTPDHIIAAISRQVRSKAAGRETIIVAENESQHARLVRPYEAGGYGLDGVWNDDFHHSALVALTGHNEAYYTDYRGKPQEFISSMKYGYLYQGQYYKWQKKRRGSVSLDLKPASFILYLENHDQISNFARAQRITKLTSPGALRALTALLLLAPGTPMLFMGQEFASTTPFYFFADHEPGLSKLVFNGRKEFVAQFPSAATSEIQTIIANPSDPRTFQASKLDFSERDRHAEIYQMYKDLLKVRREIPHFTRQDRTAFDGAVLGRESFAIRFFDNENPGEDFLLMVNLGTDLLLSPAPEPLLAPPEGKIWALYWASEDPKYGGYGQPRFGEQLEDWCLMGHSASLYNTVTDTSGYPKELPDPADQKPETKTERSMKHG